MAGSASSHKPTIFPTVGNIPATEAPLLTGRGVSADLAATKEVELDTARFLARVQEALPLLADLSKGDLILYVPGPQPNTAVVLAHVVPHTVPAVHGASLAGRQVGRKSDPGPFQILQPGRLPRHLHGAVDRSASTVQQFHPVVFGGRTVGALGIETNQIEHERMRKKSPVFRKALAHLLEMALAGEVAGMTNLTPLGEHDGLLVVDADSRIRYVSGVAANLYRKLGYSESLVGTSLAHLEANERVFFRAIERGECVEDVVREQEFIWIKKAVPLLARESSRLPVIGPARRRWTSAILVIQDITEQRQKEQALRIKSAMIQEVHHRVKNNLQTIAALLRLQARRANSPELTRIVQDSVNRILSIAVVHEFLSHDADSVINIREMCEHILSEVTQGMFDPEKQIQVHLKGDDLYLPAQKATSCALIVNELLQNAIEHGFASRDCGSITVRLLDAGTAMIVEIADDGEGLPPGFDSISHHSLGLQIVTTLVTEDLKGTFELVDKNGVVARVTVPKLRTED